MTPGTKGFLFTPSLRGEAHTQATPRGHYTSLNAIFQFLACGIMQILPLEARFFADFPATGIQAQLLLLPCRISPMLLE